MWHHHQAFFHSFISSGWHGTTGPARISRRGWREGINRTRQQIVSEIIHSFIRDLLFLCVYRETMEKLDPGVSQVNPWVFPWQTDLTFIFSKQIHFCVLPSPVVPFVGCYLYLEYRACSVLLYGIYSWLYWIRICHCCCLFWTFHTSLVYWLCFSVISLFLISEFVLVCFCFVLFFRDHEVCLGLKVLLGFLVLLWVKSVLN